MIAIEFENPIIDKCDCCGEEMVRLTRFVHQNDNAYAVYYAKFRLGGCSALAGVQQKVARLGWCFLPPTEYDKYSNFF